MTENRSEEVSVTVHVILDFEMNPVSAKTRSGFKRKEKHLYTELIEIGAVKLREDYSKAGEFSVLIRPVMNTRIEPNITSLTGITFENVEGAVSFADALASFSSWIGDGEACIYSWSRNDQTQLQNECNFKAVPFPENMQKWEDFQEMFPRITEINLQRQMSLEAAAQMAGVLYEEEKAHRALYDAEVTAELVKMVLSGAYRESMASVRNVIKPSVEHSTFSLGDKFGAQLAALFADRPDEKCKGENSKR